MVLFSATRSPRWILEAQGLLDLLVWNSGGTSGWRERLGWPPWLGTTVPWALSPVLNELPDPMGPAGSEMVPRAFPVPGSELYLCQVLE